GLKNALPDWQLMERFRSFDSSFAVDPAIGALREALDSGRLTACRDDFVERLIGRANLEVSETERHAGMLGHEFDGVFEIAGCEEQDAADLLLRLGVRPVGNDHAAIALAYCGRLIRGLQRLPAEKVAAATQFVVISEALFHHCRQLFLAVVLHRLHIGVAEANELHGSNSGGVKVALRHSRTAG